jgi:hypothetical protein
MKRTYDNTTNSNFAGTPGQISTGQMATKDTVYYSSNMVNLQREDHTELHGIETQFNQTRVLPIVGKTSRAEIALKSADIQTKALPIFQPQVQINSDPSISDPDRLIYEVGISATWRNSMLALPPDGVTLSSLAVNGTIPYPNDTSDTAVVTPDTAVPYWGESTFQNVPNASLPVIDAYNITTNLTLYPSTLKDTYLRTLFEYYRGTITPTTVSTLRQTCLTPVVVPSVKAKIISTDILLSGPFSGSLAAIVDSIDGFKIGDRLRLFGCSDGATPLKALENVYCNVIAVIDAYLPNSSTTTSTTFPALVLDYDLLESIAVSTFVYNPGPPPSTITFTVVDNSMFQIGDTITIEGATDPTVNQTYIIDSFRSTTGITCLANFIGPGPSPSPCSIVITGVGFENGYAINLTVKNGGHIEFLTDEHEFQPIELLGGITAGNPYTGTLDLVNVTTPVFIPNTGFYRGFTAGGIEVYKLNAIVEIKATRNLPTNQDELNYLAQTYNGYYQIVARSNTTISFAPLSKSIPPINSLYNVQCFFEVKLAPNFYTFDTRSDEIIDPVVTFNKMNFMRAIGYTPTKQLPIQSPTYPPTASTPPQTWTRAYTVAWNFSAYRNVQWLTQDTTSQTPQKPLQYQDFGVDNGSSTYYNVYELNKFYNDCVNPAIENVINDTTAEVIKYEAFSLDRQLAFNYNGYRQLLTYPASNFLWSPSTTYTIGNLAVSGVTSSSLAFIASRTSPAPGALPSLPESNDSWIFIGYVPYQSGDLTPYALVLIYDQPSSALNVMGASVVSNVFDQPSPNPYILVSYSNLTSTNAFIPLPVFKTIGPYFHYNSLTLLSFVKYDGYGFGTINVVQTDVPQETIALYDYTRQSWGNQGANNADEWVTFESNTSFKFLLDNFPSYCTAYADTLAELRTGDAYPLINYWVWDSTSSHDPRTDGQFYEISQTSESLSSCMSPVESIVVVSENIPVLDELASPAFYLVDSDSSTFINANNTISLTQKIIGEIPLYNFAPYNIRSVIRYDANELHFCSLLDTRLFKQLEYSLYYRHRITQQLIPLVLTNYGSVNIKFVFRPIS